MSFEDAKHRPHAVHTGEEPRNPITYGPESLKVTLDRWGPVDDLFTSMYDALQANWGDSPSRTVNRRKETGLLGTWGDPASAVDDRVDDALEVDLTGWRFLHPHERDYVESCFAGKTLQQVLEGVTFDFCIDGVARAFTHQNVRTRLGAGFMQHGGRDNDWRHRAWTMPETIRRACVLHFNNGSFGGASGVPWVARTEDLKSCITNERPIRDLLSTTPAFDGPDREVDNFGDPTLECLIEQHLRKTRDLYAALVDSGIPWQDARRVLPIGMQTYIHDQYNYLALQGVLANRLEHVMDWEFNCVAQLMLREVKMKCPPLISKYLGSHSDKAKQAKFAGLESWPPDGKYPNPYERCRVCGHAKANHTIEYDPDRYAVCEACERSEVQTGPDSPDCTCGGQSDGQHSKSCAKRTPHYHEYVAVDSLPRQHRSEQMPFFVLHPDSMAGGPIVWIPTNGKYPHEVIDAVGRR